MNLADNHRSTTWGDVVGQDKIRSAKWGNIDPRPPPA